MKKQLLSEITKVKELWAQGVEGEEARLLLQVSQARYKKILNVAGVDDDFNIDNIWKKFVGKQQIRYLQIMKIKEMAEELSPPDLSVMKECVRLLIEIDNNIIKVGQSLGIIYRSPETLEIKAPPEIIRLQDELKELELEYLRLSGKYGKSKIKGFSPEGLREANKGDEAEDTGGEEKALTETTSILAPRTEPEATPLLPTSLQPSES